MLSGLIASTGADLEPHPSFAQFLLGLEMPASKGESGFLPVTPMPLTSSVNMRRGTDRHQAGGDSEGVDNDFVVRCIPP